MRRHLVLGAVALVVVVGAALRTVAVSAGWFHFDDFRLLLDALGQSPTPDYLLTPYDNQLMPGGRALAAVVAEAGPLSWAAAALMTAVWQFAALAAAAWALISLFGLRWGVLVPLALYASTPLTMPALLWWAAALNQLPLQVAFFLAVGSWVRYLRGENRRWLLASGAAVALGLLFYVKALLVLPVLAYLAVAYFAEGSLKQRVVAVARRWPEALVGGAMLVAVYVLVYTIRAPAPFESGASGVLGSTFETMVLRSFGTGVLGGPWRWAALGADVRADPPVGLVVLAWLGIAAVIALLALQRERTGRAWLLLAGYLGGAFLLLVTSRAASVGSVVGLDVRYLTDVAPVAALAVGLAVLPLKGALEPSAPRPPRAGLPSVPPWVGPAVAAVVVVSGVVSCARYADLWVESQVSDDFIAALTADLERHGAVDLLDTAPPPTVMSPFSAPANRIRTLTDLIGGAEVRYPATSGALTVVGSDGLLHEALIEEPAGTTGTGPVPGCGWQVGSEGAVIPFAQPTPFDWVWWLRIGYLSSAATPVQVTADGTSVDAELREGLGSLFVRIEGEVDAVRIDGLDRGVSLCVDRVDAGEPIPGEPLP